MQAFYKIYKFYKNAKKIKFILLNQKKCSIILLLIYKNKF